MEWTEWSEGLEGTRKKEKRKVVRRERIGWEGVAVSQLELLLSASELDVTQ